jgi:multidrug efflux pump subunit AcrB
VATVKVHAEPAAITHDDVLRDVEVAAKVTGDPSSVAAAVRSRIAAMPMPYEYHAEVSGNATVKQADLLRTLAYGGVVLVGIFLLIQAAVASWRRAALLLLSLPLSVVGGVLLAPLAGGIWSTGSLAGLLAVFALAIRSAIMLGRRISDEEQAGGLAGSAAVLMVSRERAVPPSCCPPPCWVAARAWSCSTPWRSPCSAGWSASWWSRGTCCRRSWPP